MTSPSTSMHRRPPSSPFGPPPVPAPLPTFACDDRVSHDSYGLGRVAVVEEGCAVTVQFGAGQLRITAPYHKLTKL